MRYELYNIFLIRTSERARSEIIDQLSLWSGQSREDLLLWFRRKNVFAELASHLNGDPKRGFELLSRHLRHKILNRLAPDFGAEDLLPFLNGEGHLAQILDCHCDEVFDYLLDSYELLHAVSKIDFTRLSQQLALLSEKEYFLPPADTLFLSMLGAYKQSTEFSKSGRIEIGRRIDELHLLRGKASIQLRKYAIKKGYLRGTDSGFLKTTLDSEGGSDRFNEVSFDTLAIIHLKQRIVWIVQQMRDEAWELMEGIDPFIPEFSYLLYLRAQVEFYQLNAPALAWERILSHLIDVNQSSSEIGAGDFDRILLDAFEKFKLVLIPCLILAVINPPLNFDTFGSKPLTLQSPIAAVDREQDVEFLFSQKEILETIRNEYVEKERYEFIE